MRALYLLWRILFIDLGIAVMLVGCGGGSPQMVSISLNPAGADLTAGGAPLPLTARAIYDDGTTSDITARVLLHLNGIGQLTLRGAKDQLHDT
jgi:hypothetical protein